MAAIKNIDDEKFKRKVETNKKAFYNWVKAILEKEKQAEKQRNDLLKKKMIQMLKEYSKGIEKDITDKKYELSMRKKEADDALKNLKKQEEKIGAWESEITEKEQNIDTLIEKGIETKIDKKLKNKRAALTKAQNKSKELIEEYNKKFEVFKDELLKFRNEKKDAKELLEQVPILKRKKTMLENKSSKLDELSKSLSEKEKLLKTQEQDLLKREKEAEKILKREKELSLSEKELKLKWDEYEVHKKQIRLMQKENEELNKLLISEKKDFDVLRHDLEDEEKSVAERLRETRLLEEDLLSKEKSNLNKPKPFNMTSEVFEENDDFTKSISPDVKQLFLMIQQCKDMLENNQLVDAKNYYRTIKEKFSKSKMESREKEIVYNTIRELYDDISLALVDYS
jgi:hypothetical protein